MSLQINMLSRFVISFFPRSKCLLISWLHEYYIITIYSSHWRSWYKPYIPKTSLSYLCMCVCAQSCLTLCDPMDYNPPASSVHGIFSKNNGVGCHFLFQGIFPTQGSNPCLQGLRNWQAESLPLSHLGTPHLLTKQQVRLGAHGNWVNWRVHLQTGSKFYQYPVCSLVGS